MSGTSEGVEATTCHNGEMMFLERHKNKKNDVFECTPKSNSNQHISSIFF
jgi:hypothetical protein